MSKDWKADKLGVFLELKRGYDLPQKQRVPGEYPIVSSSGITDYHAMYKVSGPGVVTGRYGTIGEVYYITHDFWPLNTTLYVKDFKKNNPQFVYYFLKTIDYQLYNSKSAVPGINRNDLHMSDVTFPSLKVQDKIVAILSLYDQLINNNDRRIAILEEIAQRIYREWFMHFRYPGNDVNSMLYDVVSFIPKGWASSCLGDVAYNFDKKRKPLSGIVRSQKQGTIPYYGAAKVLDYIDDYIFKGIYLLVAEDGSVIDSQGHPVLQYVSGEIWVNNHAHVLQGKPPISTEFLYLALKEVAISAYITGAAQPKITQDNLNRIPILVPDNKTLTTFQNIIQPLYFQIIQLQRKNDMLSKTRDLLLPRLISGDLDVSDLDIKEVTEKANT